MKYLDDILWILGCSLIVVGSYLVNPVLIWFVAGALLIVSSVLIGLGARGEK